MFPVSFRSFNHFPRLHSFRLLVQSVWSFLGCVIRKSESQVRLAVKFLRFQGMLQGSDFAQREFEFHRLRLIAARLWRKQRSFFELAELTVWLNYLIFGTCCSFSSVLERSKMGAGYHQVCWICFPGAISFTATRFVRHDVQIFCLFSLVWWLWMGWFYQHSYSKNSSEKFFTSSTGGFFEVRFLPSTFLFKSLACLLILSFVSFPDDIFDRMSPKATRGLFLGFVPNSATSDLSTVTGILPGLLMV